MIKKAAILFLFCCMPFMTVFGQLIDKKATVETKNLFKNLTKISGKATLFGHQDDLAYGVGWKGEQDRSDIRDLTGEYPAVLGWDVSGLEIKNEFNLDGVPFEKIRQYIKKGYDLGTINTLSWHMYNPINGKNSWDTVSSVSVKSILPGGIRHALYKTWLDEFSIFVKTLKGSDGKAIPLLFRPFHEHSGNWFWWGAKSCTPQQYQQLWQFTVKYLRDTKQLHNLIYVFNPCGFNSAQEYLERYPGDAFVDVLSFDDYQLGDTSKGKDFKDGLIKKIAIQHQIAVQKHKLSALGELGYVEIPDPKWWTNVFAPSIEKNAPIYALFWRNAGYRKQENDNHYYAPYPGQTSAADFLEMIKSNKTILLQKGIKTYAVYQ